MTGKAFHNVIEHIKLFEFKDDLMNSVTDCMDIYSELFYGDFEHYYIKGAGRQGTARVFWSDLDEEQKIIIYDHQINKKGEFYKNTKRILLFL